MTAELNPASDWCQRWTDRHQSWRHKSDGGFDSARYTVEEIVGDTVAKDFVIGHHYSGTYPSAKWRFGLYEADRLVGVAVLSCPTQASVLTGVFPGLEPYVASVELGRFVLVDEVPANGESWFLGRIFAAAAAKGARGIVSFADPVPRRSTDGRVVMPGHVGRIYMATNARYTGRGYSQALDLLPNGEILSRRAQQKVRSGERGHEYVERSLIALGARAPRAGEKPAVWLAEAKAAVGVRKLRHGGNHRFAFPIGDRGQRRRVQILQPPLPYPKQVAAAA